MSRKKLPYYEMYPADFDTDENVRVMSHAELGFYVRCLNHAWLNGSIPSDPEELARAMKTPLKEVRALMVRVGKCFRETSPGRVTNPRQEEQREEAKAKSETARNSASHRWQKGGPSRASPQRDANAMRTQCERNAYQNQRQHQHIKAAAVISSFPLAAAAVREFFPTSDSEVFDRIAQKATEVAPSITDEQLATAIREARDRKPNQREATLFVKTVPEIIRSRCQKAPPAPTKSNAPSPVAIAEAKRILDDPAAAAADRELAQEFLEGVV